MGERDEAGKVGMAGRGEEIQVNTILDYYHSIVTLTIRYNRTTKYK